MTNSNLVYSLTPRFSLHFFLRKDPIGVIFSIFLISPGSVSLKLHKLLFSAKRELGHIKIQGVLPTPKTRTIYHSGEKKFFFGVVLLLQHLANDMAKIETFRQ